MRGVKGREKYVWILWPAFRAKECNNCVQQLQVKCMVCNLKHLSSLAMLFCVTCACDDRKHIQNDPSRHTLKVICATTESFLSHYRWWSLHLVFVSQLHCRRKKKLHICVNNTSVCEFECLQFPPHKIVFDL